MVQLSTNETLCSSFGLSLERLDSRLDDTYTVLMNAAVVLRTWTWTVKKYRRIGTFIWAEVLAGGRNKASVYGRIRFHSSSRRCGTSSPAGLIDGSQKGVSLRTSFFF